MRIAWVLYGDLDQRTGGTIYDRLVVDGLRRAGDEVRVLSLDGAPSARRGIGLARRIARTPADVVVGDELCFRELAVALPLLRRTRRVLLVHHLTSWETELSRRARAIAARLERLALRAADRVIATSETTRDRLDLRDVLVARPGCDRLPREPRARSGGVLLFVGALIRRKRVLELVRAFARSAARDGRLVLAGSRTRDVAYAGEIATAVDELGLRERVAMPGELEDVELARRLAEADALVMPSSLEGWGIAATEAIHAGTPVIAARTSGLVEALAPCASATIFVDGEDDLARAISRFTSSAQLREEMARAAIEHAPALPAWSACVDAFRAALMS